MKTPHDNVQQLIDQAVNAFMESPRSVAPQYLNALFELRRNLETYYERQLHSSNDETRKETGNQTGGTSEENSTTKRSHTGRGKRKDQKGNGGA